MRRPADLDRRVAKVIRDQFVDTGYDWLDVAQDIIVGLSADNLVISEAEGPHVCDAILRYEAHIDECLACRQTWPCPRAKTEQRP